MSEELYIYCKYRFVNEISSPHTCTYNRYTIPLTYPNLKMVNHGRNM